MGDVGGVAEADHTIHPIGWSVYDVAAQSSAIFLRSDSTDVQKVEKRNGITDLGWD